MLSELEESCTISVLTDACSSSSSSKLAEDRSQQTLHDEQRGNVSTILNSMLTTLSTSLDTRIAYHYELVPYFPLSYTLTTVTVLLCVEYIRYLRDLFEICFVA